MSSFHKIILRSQPLVGVGSSGEQEQRNKQEAEDREAKVLS